MGIVGTWCEIRKTLYGGRRAARKSNGFLLDFLKKTMRLLTDLYKLTQFSVRLQILNLEVIVKLKSFYDR